MIINCVHGGWHKVKDLLSEIESYWTTRAEGYSEVNHKELNGMQRVLVELKNCLKVE